MKIDIPLPCPICGGSMYSINHKSFLTVLKKRSWQVCKECNFERDSEEFKKINLLCMKNIDHTKQFLM